ncbi:helix-turn-helix domain-containing protein [Bisbaumannia pacifica]|nr:helix-turn-helix domain-containing protein [Halomonas pacifica]
MTDLFYDKKVDSCMATSSSPIHKPLAVEGCSPEMAAAIEAFSTSITPSHTLRSRRYSLLSLVAKHLDDAASISIRRTLSGFNQEKSFSQHVKHTGCNNLIKTFKLLSRQAGLTPRDQADIDCLMDVLFFIKSRTPSESIAAEINLIEKPFCELCWRFTIAYDRYSNGEEAEMRNARYCEFHNPSSNPSAYRNDHRYRKDFEEWLIAMGGEKELNLSSDLKQQEAIRKKAYALAHAKLTERRVKILKLYAAGFSQKKIADKLGISPQAVSKSLFKLRGYFSTWADIALGQELESLKHSKD